MSDLLDYLRIVNAQVGPQAAHRGVAGILLEGHGAPANLSQIHHLFYADVESGTIYFNNARVSTDSEPTGVNFEGVGSSSQDMQVAWTPTNFKLGELMGFVTNGTGPNLVGITALIFSGATLNYLSLSYANDTVSVSGPLATSSGFLSITQCPGLSSVSFPVLSSVAGNFSLGFLNGLTSASFPSLETVGAPFAVYNSPLITSSSFPALTSVTGNLDVDTNDALATLNLNALITATGGLAIETNPLLTSISLAAYVPTNGQDQLFDGNALNAATVNLVLHRAVLNAGYVSGTINLSGGTNAAPSGAGIADKATLIGRGVTVNTN